MHISTKKLAEKTGIAPSTLSSLLSGKRTTTNSNLEKIFKVLKISLVPVPNFEFGSVDFSNLPCGEDQED